MTPRFFIFTAKAYTRHQLRWPHEFLGFDDLKRMNKTDQHARSDHAIAMLGCFDTKGADFAYLRERLLAHGQSVITINTGVLGRTDHFPIDIEAWEIAEAGGDSLDALRQQADRGHAIEVMGRGAAIVLGRLAAEGKLKAVIGMGGGGGTFLALAAMQAVPLGIPKVCISTVASKDLSKQVGAKDITLVPSIVDVAGLNSISRRLIRQVAAATAAMANTPQTDLESQASKGRIAISMFGNTTACVTACTALLEAKGYEVFTFHANGVGGQTMESLIYENCFDGVLDLTTTELADELCGGVCSAGPLRLEAAAAHGIPQVVAPGCLDMVNFAHPDTVPPAYQNRRLYSWAPDVTLMRTDEAENRKLGKILTAKLRHAPAGAIVLLPMRGLSQIDDADGVFHFPEANQALFEAIKSTASDQVEVREIDAHINDETFARQAVDTLLERIEAHRAKHNTDMPSRSPA